MALRTVVIDEVPASLVVVDAPVEEVNTQVKRRRIDEGVGKVIEEKSMLARVREIGDGLMIIVEQEREKKKLSIAAIMAFKGVKGRFEAAFDEVFEENTILRGRLEEARAQIAALVEGRARAEETVVSTPRTPPTVSPPLPPLFNRRSRWRWPLRRSSPKRRKERTKRKGAR